MDIAQWPTNRLLNTAARLSENRENERLRRLGTTHAGLLTLRVLGRRKTVNQVELARELRVQAQTVGKLLERLESRNLVARTKSADDRRVFFVSLTSEGENLLRRAQLMEEQDAGSMNASDSLLRQELISHIRDLGGFPHPADQRAPLRMVRDDDGEDRSERNLTAG